MNGYHNIYEYNELYEFSKEVNDQAAIYGGSRPAWGTLGSVFRHNYFHDARGVPGHSYAALYADCDTTMGSVYGNVFANLRSPGGGGTGILLNGGRLNHVIGNLFANIDRPIRVGRGSNKPSQGEPWLVKPYLKLIAGNPLFQKYPHSQEPARVPKAEWDEQLTRPLYNTIASNVFYNSGSMSLLASRMTAKQIAEARKTWTVSMNRTCAEGQSIGFQDARRRDYTLLEGSLVFRDVPGFPAIPFRRMGRAGRLDPLAVEFEDFDMSGGGFIPAVEDGIACGECVLESGAGRKEFRGSAGTYDITLRYKDARDGKASLSLAVVGEVRDSWRLDQNNDKWRVRTAGRALLKPGDEVRIDAHRDQANLSRRYALYAVRSIGSTETDAADLRKGRSGLLKMSSIRCRVLPR